MFLATAADTAQIVAAVAAVIQTVIVAVAAAYGLVQLSEAKRSRRMSAVMPIFERLHDAEATERRRLLYQEIAPAFPNLSPAQESIIQEVISDFHFVGYLVEKRLIEFHLVADLYYGTVVRCWQACEPYVQRDRQRRGTRYAAYFESFYYRCLEYGRIYKAAEPVLTFGTPPAP
jgi:hypothetical protein